MGNVVMSKDHRTWGLKALVLTSTLIPTHQLWVLGEPLFSTCKSIKFPSKLVHRTVVRISILCFKINTYHLLSLGGRIIGDSHFLDSGLLYVQNTLQITLHLKNLKSLSFKSKNTFKTTQVHILSRLYWTFSYLSDSICKH